MYTANQACEYLGIHKQSLEKYQRQGKLRADTQFPNGERMYEKETLDAFKERWQSQMMTQEEIAKMFGVARTAVRYHFKIKRSITADADRGMFGTYSDAKVLMVARSAGWVKDFEQESIGSEYIGLMFVKARDQWTVFHRKNRCLFVLDRLLLYLDAKKIMNAAVTMRRLQVRNPQ
jgi:predicted transcriptional regulator